MSEKSDRDYLVDIYSKVSALETTVNKTRLLDRVNRLEGKINVAGGAVMGAWFIMGLVGTYLYKHLPFK